MPRKREESVRQSDALKKRERYYSDRTFLLCLLVSVYALLLCTFGRIDGGSLIGILTFTVGGFITKRSLEGKSPLPEAVTSDKE